MISQFLSLVRQDQLVVMQSTANEPWYIDPGWAQARLMTGAGTFTCIIRDDQLVVMESDVLGSRYVDSGWANARLIAAAGNAVCIIRGDQLVVLDTDTYHVRYIDNGWSDARLMAGAGGCVCIIRGDELFVMDTQAYDVRYTDSGWTHARMMVGAGNRIGIVRDDQFVVMETRSYFVRYIDLGWTDARLMAGAGDRIGIIRGDQLVVMETEFLGHRYIDTGWTQARLMAGTGNALGILRGDQLVVMETEFLGHRYIDPGWAEARLLGGGVSGPFPRYLARALEIVASQSNLPQEWADDMLARLEACAYAAKERYAQMTESERDEIASALGNSGLSLWSLPLPEFGPFPSPIELFPIPDVNVDAIPAISSGELVQTVQDKVTGLVGSAFETVKEAIVQLPQEACMIVGNFAERITTVGDLLASGKVDQAIAGVFEAITLLARDVHAGMLAVMVNLAVDVVAGVIGGVCLGRPLTPGERDFAHSIFHGKINLTFVRVVVIDRISGLTSASTIHVPSMDLSNPKAAARFAHELTHVYQDQTLIDPGTLHAAHEFLNHYFGSGKDPYKVVLTGDTQWHELGVEQQAQVVEDWQLHKDGKHVETVAMWEAFYQKVLNQVGFF